MIQPAIASSSLETLQARARSQKLSAHPYWHRLLHYSRNLRGVYQSEIDDPSFLASPRGRRDPEAELDSTLAAFFAPPPQDPEKQQAQCRYPARLAWLKEQLGITARDLPAVSCSRFEKWKEQIHPQSVSVVFASSFMNNPSSMYGHTFLLLKKQDEKNQGELLDYAVNFAADMENDNGILYAVKGLMGGYHGRFSSFPYYMKVQEYSNLESRDLWEYDLNLSSAGVRRLVEHLWEMGNVRIPYYFFNKNCSYYLMPILEVVAPDRDFKKEFVFKAIPVDTLRAVIKQPGLVGKVTRRPSHTAKLLAERRQLSESEIHLAESLAVNPEVTNLGSLAPERKAVVLDTAYDLFRYRVGFSREQAPEVQQAEHKLLLMRNEVGSHPPTEILVGDVPVRPDFGHPTGRLSISYGFSNHSHFEELSLRAAAHDEDDPPEGYLPGSKLEMLHAKLRYDNDRETLYVQQATLVDLLSLSPWDRWIHPLSWKISTGLAVANDLNRDSENSLYYGLNFGSGYSAWVPGIKKMLIFGMAEFETELGAPFEHDVRAGGGPCGGLLYMPVSFWRARLAASNDWWAVGGTASTTKLGFYQSLSLTKTLELRATLERQNIYKEVLFSLAWFL